MAYEARACMTKAGSGFGKPGAVADMKPHLGRRLLERYGSRISGGLDDLERFELLDRLQKPVLHFYFYGNKKLIIEIDDLLSQFLYSYIVQTRAGRDIWHLPKSGVRFAEVYISRFPKLVKFIAEHEGAIPDDLWGLLFGYPLPEAHLFAYDHDRFMAALPPDKGTAARQAYR